VNLDLPFAEPEGSALDDRFAALDDELEALFLAEVQASVHRQRDERSARAAADGAVA
jgi:hypothetical protein